MGKRKAGEDKAPPPPEEDVQSEEEAATPKSSKVLKKLAARTSASLQEEPHTAAALKKHDEQLKNKLKAGTITKDQFEKALGKEGVQRQRQKFAYARRANMEVDQGLKDLSRLGRGAQQNSKQKMLLFAWLKDPTFGSSYMSVMTSLEAEEAADLAHLRADPGQAWLRGSCDYGQGWDPDRQKEPTGQKVLAVPLPGGQHRDVHAAQEAGDRNKSWKDEQCPLEQLRAGFLVRAG